MHHAAAPRRAIVIASLFATFTWPGAAQTRPGPPLPPPERVQVPAGGASVPLYDFGGRPVVDVSINSHGPYRFIVDTGAAITVLSPGLISELQLPPAPGRPSPGPVRVEELKIGAAVLGGVTVGRVGLLAGTDPAEPRGVLSAAAFANHLVVIDPFKKLVTIRPGALPAADGASIFEYSADEVLPVIPVRIAGREFHLRFDSGSPGMVSLPTKYIGELPLAGKPVEVGQAQTAAGTFPLLEAEFGGTIEIGRFPIQLGKIQFSDVRAGPAAGLGIVGSGVISTFVMTFDATNRRIRLERGVRAPSVGRGNPSVR